MYLVMILMIVKTIDEILQKLEGGISMVCTMMMVAYDTHNLFALNKLKEGGQTIVNHNVMWFIDILNRMRNVPALFKVLTNFEVYAFHEYVSLVCPTILDNACNMGVEALKAPPYTRLLASKFFCI